MAGHFHSALRSGPGWVRGRAVSDGMRDILFIVHDGCGLHARGHGRLGGSGRKRRGTTNPFEVGIDDDLAVVPQVYGLELVELLAPLLNMRDVGLVALKIISRAEMDENFAVRIGDSTFTSSGSLRSTSLSSRE